MARVTTNLYRGNKLLDVIAASLTFVLSMLLLFFIGIFISSYIEHFNTGKSMAHILDRKFTTNRVVKPNLLKVDLVYKVVSDDSKLRILNTCGKTEYIGCMELISSLDPVLHIDILSPAVKKIVSELTGEELNKVNLKLMGEMTTNMLMDEWSIRQRLYKNVKEFDKKYKRKRNENSNNYNL